MDYKDSQKIMPTEEKLLDDMKNDGDYGKALYNARLKADPLNKQKIDNIYIKYKNKEPVQIKESLDRDKMIKIYEATQVSSDECIKWLGIALIRADTLNKDRLYSEFPYIFNKLINN